jgi:hypothetical protein
VRGMRFCMSLSLRMLIRGGLGDYFTDFDDLQAQTPSLPLAGD